MMVLLDKFQHLEGRIRELLAERDALKVHAEQLQATGGPSKDTAQDAEGLQKAHNLLMREREVVRDRVEALVRTISRLSKAN